MKRLAGMLAVLLVSAAQSQTPAADAAAPTAVQPLVAASNQLPDLTVAPSAGAADNAAAASTATPDAAVPPAAQSQATLPPMPPQPSMAAPTATAQATLLPPPSTAMPTATAQATLPPPPSTPVPTATAQATMPPPPSTAVPTATEQAATARAPPATAPPQDVTQATSYLKSAANDFTNCRRPSACNAYFDSFGVAISFADGSISPYSHVQRLSATSRECVKKAKILEEEGDRSLAVQWAMAARVENRNVRDWLGNHPDAVLAALRQFTAL